MKNRTKTSDGTDLIRELQDIKRLLIMVLVRSGASQGDVAMALNVNQSSVSRMFPKQSGKTEVSRR
jgi:predicted transcriptional regulator